jgi:hypothetical protein
MPMRGKGIGVLRWEGARRGTQKPVETERDYKFQSFKKTVDVVKTGYRNRRSVMEVKAGG